MKIEWQHDKETGEHFLIASENEAWKVYRTSAGDYAMTLYNDDDGFGDEVEYFDTLRQAKIEAERRIQV